VGDIRQRLLLTGAHGFTGRRLHAASTAAGYDVIAQSADLTDEDAVTESVLTITPDAVIHLAAISAVTHHDALAFYRVNVFSTQNLLTALTLLPRKPSAVLLASSANVYGNCETSPISELEMPEPVNHYALSKLAAEGVARMFAGQLPMTVIRPFNYTGRGHDTRFVIPKIVQAYRGRNPVLTLGNLQVEREYNDVRFVVNAYLELLRAGKPNQTYNLCSGIPYSLTDVLRIMNDLSGYSPKIEVDHSLFRANEVRRLCGSPKKLADTINPVVQNNLRPLLQWMLESDVAEAG
jgi:GDP-6-deoxy-D-talose 4-dehydrogenase